MGGDQCAVDQQIRVAPDRRGEMTVATQRQAEMPRIVGAVDRFRLAAQDQQVDQMRIVLVHGLGQNSR